MKKGYKHSEETKRKITQKATGRILSTETRLKLSKIRKGKLVGVKNPNWKGGVTPIHQAIRNSPEYKLWRKAVFERDGYKCVWCGVKTGLGKDVILQADHIKPFAYFPELRFAIDNGRTLCIDCHRTTSTYGFKKI